jgi:hypothetical protein
VLEGLDHAGAREEERRLLTPDGVAGGDLYGADGHRFVLFRPRTEDAGLRTLAA